MKILARFIFFICWILEIYFTYAVTDDGKVKMRFCDFNNFIERMPKGFLDRILEMHVTQKSRDLYEMPFRRRAKSMELDNVHELEL